MCSASTDTPFRPVRRRLGLVWPLLALAAATAAHAASAQTPGAGPPPAAQAPSASAGAIAAPEAAPVLPPAAAARIEVQTSDGKGSIQLDGKRVGEGSFAAEVPAGSHTLSVSREGFKSFDRSLEVKAGQTLVETVTLEPALAPSVAKQRAAPERIYEGLYGGFQLLGLVMPGGQDNTLDIGCDSLGSVSCASSTPAGGGVAGYIGYAVQPVGLELYFGGKLDRARPTATFDGVKGSEINPTVAQPARTEEFLFLRGGGFGALRARFSWDGAPWRVSGAGGVGLAYNHMAMKRATHAAGGGESSFAAESMGYLTPQVSLDLSAQYHVASPTTVTVGLAMLLENAGQKARTQADGKQVLIPPAGAGLPQPLATPAYDMASGPQFYLMPYAGMQFGP
jgi:hypothetical protein